LADLWYMITQIEILQAAVVALRDALVEANESMPKYAHPLLSKDFTERQLYAILVLSRFLGADIQGVIQELSDSPDLCEVLGLERIPDYATLFHAEERLIRKGFLEKA
jgi:hypothetical protein